MATVVGVLDRDCWSARTDNIVLADPGNKSLTWIPRDLWCPSLGDRINMAFRVGGIPWFISALRELGFPCDHGLVLRRSATERAATRISVEVPVEQRLDYWYPLHPTIAIHGPRKPVTFQPPSEHLEGHRVHEWVGSRKAIAVPSMSKFDTDWHRLRRQHILLRALLDQHFDFASIMADTDLVRMSGEEALKELASIDASWRMETFKDTQDATIAKKMVLIKRHKQAAPNVSGSGSPELAVVVLALEAPVETVDAVKSLLAQEPQVELVVVNSGGGGMAALLARHGIDVPVIEREERLYAGAARNIGIKATRAPYVAFLASDCRATGDWVARRIAAHRAGRAAVGSAVVNDSPKSPVAWAGHLALWSRRMPNARRGLPYGASYDRRLFEAFGFFREDLRAGEDTEFNRRLPMRLRPKWNKAIHTIHRNPTRLVRMIADQFQRGARAASFEQEFRDRALGCGFGSWWRRSGRTLEASRKVSRQHRRSVILARPLIPLAVAAYCLGARYWQLTHRAI